MPKPKVVKLNGRQVLARMRKGDLPTIKCGHTSKSVFSDGAEASHAVMTKLLRDNKIDPPKHASLHSPWTLHEE